MAQQATPWGRVSHVNRKASAFVETGQSMPQMELCGHDQGWGPCEVHNQRMGFGQRCQEGSWAGSGHLSAGDGAARQEEQKEPKEAAIALWGWEQAAGRPEEMKEETMRL
jgi:hypothetical protein